MKRFEVFTCHMTIYQLFKRYWWLISLWFQTKTKNKGNSYSFLFVFPKYLLIFCWRTDSIWNCLYLFATLNSWISGIFYLPWLVVIPKRVPRTQSVSVILLKVKDICIYTWNKWYCMSSKVIKSRVYQVKVLEVLLLLERQVVDCLVFLWVVFLFFIKSIKGVF